MSPTTRRHAGTHPGTPPAGDPLPPKHPAHKNQKRAEDEYTHLGSGKGGAMATMARVGESDRRSEADKGDCQHS